jgi:hypothetical protein
MQKYPGLEEDRTLMKKILSSGNQFLVVSRSEGLGDVLFAVAHAWLYCKKTGRTLVIDLANSRYLKDKEANAAFFLLKFPENFESVRIIVIPRISWNLRRNMEEGWLLQKLLIASSRLYAYLNLFLSKIPYWETTSKPLTLAEEKELIRNGKRVGKKFLSFKGCHWEFREEIKNFLQSVSLPSKLQDQVNGLLATLRGPFIGVHVRYYDPSRPEFRHSRFWTDFNGAISEIETRIKAVSDLGMSEQPIFLATDSKEVEAALCQRFPRMAVLRKNFSDPTKGELHESNVERLGEDAAIEMFALGHASALVRYPPSKSWFSELAALKCDQVFVD